MCLLAHKLHSMLIFESSSTMPTYHNLMVCAETTVTTNTILLLLLLLLLLGEMIICGRCAFHTYGRVHPHMAPHLLPPLLYFLAW